MSDPAAEATRNLPPPVDFNQDLADAAKVIAADPLALSVFSAQNPKEMDARLRRLASSGSVEIKRATRKVFTAAPVDIRKFAAVLIATEESKKARTELMTVFPEDVSKAAVEIRKKATDVQISFLRGQLEDAIENAEKQAEEAKAKQNEGLTNAGMPSSCSSSKQTCCLFGMTKRQLVVAGVVVAVGVALAVPAYRKFKEWRARRQVQAAAEEEGDEAPTAPAVEE